MFVIRGAYRRRVNQMVERLRNNFYNSVHGVGIISDTNNNNQAGFNNLTRSLRLLNMIFPNRPVLNVRIINVRSASTAATVSDIIRNVENRQPSNVENNENAQPSSVNNIQRDDILLSENLQQEREEAVPSSSNSAVSSNEIHVTQRTASSDDNNDILDTIEGASQTL